MNQREITGELLRIRRVKKLICRREAARGIGVKLNVIDSIENGGKGYTAEELKNYQKYLER